MFYDLLYTLKEMVSMLNLAAITCPAGLIIALHYMSERKQKVHRIDYDPVMRRKYELEAQSSTGFASFMTLVGLSVAFLSMAYLDTRNNCDFGDALIGAVFDEVSGAI